MQASSNFGCEYLHSRLSQQFLNIGGNIRWLEVGLEEVDVPKLQALAIFNSKLAYGPSEVCKNPQFLQVFNYCTNTHSIIKIILKYHKRI